MKKLYHSIKRYVHLIKIADIPDLSHKSPSQDLRFPKHIPSFFSGKTPDNRIRLDEQIEHLNSIPTTGICL